MMLFGAHYKSILIGSLLLASRALLASAYFWPSLLVPLAVGPGAWIGIYGLLGIKMVYILAVLSLSRIEYLYKLERPAMFGDQLRPDPRLPLLALDRAMRGGRRRSENDDNSRSLFPDPYQRGSRGRGVLGGRKRRRKTSRRRNSYKTPFRTYESPTYERPTYNKRPVPPMEPVNVQMQEPPPQQVDYSELQSYYNNYMASYESGNRGGISGSNSNDGGDLGNNFPAAFSPDESGSSRGDGDGNEERNGQRRSRGHGGGGELQDGPRSEEANSDSAMRLLPRVSELGQARRFVGQRAMPSPSQQRRQGPSPESRSRKRRSLLLSKLSKFT